MSVLELSFVYTVGAMGYGGLEMLWRGRTHWTMLLLGGLCFLAIYLITLYLPGHVWLKWLLCAAVITALEFGAGCLLNLRLGWAVWDYRGLPGNLLGQVCPLYACYWYLLSIPCSGFAQLIRRFVFVSSG